MYYIYCIKLCISLDPYDVIRLFPNLLPQSDSDYGEEVLEKDMEMKIVALIKYLTEVIKAFN